MSSASPPTAVGAASPNGRSRRTPTVISTAGSPSSSATRLPTCASSRARRRVTPPALRRSTPPPSGHGSPCRLRDPYDACMCRNIHTLFNFDPPATEEEVRDAALQYVRKVGGFTKPSKANEEAFARAVDEVAAATQRLLDTLVTAAPPKDREVEAARARARAAARYAS